MVRVGGVSARVAGVALLAAASLLAPPAAHAETLADALALAYQSNPTLQQQRASQRALDESYVQARAGWRPQVSASVATSYTRTDFGREAAGQPVNTSTGTVFSTGGGLYENNTGSATITASQPLYTGGRTADAVGAAQLDVLAGRQALRGIEAQVLQGVIQAYEDVRRDQAGVGIRRENLRVLSSQLEETTAKFDAGQLTRTDTAQAQAQLANARALLTSAMAQLQISRANYAAVVGQNPGDLAASPPLPGLPATVDQAFEIGEANNPGLLQAELTEQGSRTRIAEARAQNRPSVSLQGSFGYSGAYVPFDARSYDQTLTGQLVLTQPIFTGGINSSNIRQATERNTADRIAIEGARRNVVQAVSQAWNTLLAADDNVGSEGEQVKAAAVAFEGIQAQYRAGLSTTLDVLIQQETLRNAQLALVQARHDEYVAEAALLGAMGRLQAPDLVRGVPLYDPAESFARVKRASSVPWEGAVAAIDTLGAPRPGAPRPVAMPDKALAPTLVPSDSAVSVSPYAEPSTALPVAPAPSPPPTSTPPPTG